MVTASDLGEKLRAPVAFVPHGLEVVSSVAPESIRIMLADAWASGCAGSIAIETVKAQLANHETRSKRARKKAEARLPSLFDAATEKLVRAIGEDAEEEMKSMEGLPPNVLSRVALRLENMPYDMFCRAMQAAGEDEGNADEWVLRNEVWLREGSTTSEQQKAASSKHSRGDGKTVLSGIQITDWERGLVRLSAHAGVVFPGSTLTEMCRVITRPKSLPGFKILDGKRPPAIRIQPSIKMFGKTFEAMTGGLLKGLDWDNIFVAGGIVLGALLCTGDKETTNTPEQWKSSDVDLYIHGLGPIEANKKIEHIFSVFKANLGEDVPVLVVRNSKTITLFPEYPLRRVQVVLKLVDSPKDVLLNFDLDICAVGWDGEEVWMLPRAARALETGYTVFTMDLINGHYLGDRRATQEQRVFKYADKGFGIRILPSYLEECHIIKEDPEERKVLNIDGVKWDRRSFEELVVDARKWTATMIRGISKTDRNVTVPIVSHSWLQERFQTTEDPPRRSVLSGFSLFMRHVALWEHEVAGTVIIEKSTWAAPFYDNIYLERFGVSYNDAPDYSWDENFTAQGFIENMKDFNKSEYSRLTNLRDLLDQGGHIEYRPASLPPSPLHTYLIKGTLAQRISHADSVAQILQPDCDMYLPVWLPEIFIDFVNDLIPETVRKSATVPDYNTKPFMEAFTGDFPPSRVESECLRLVIWRISSVTMWQQLHRTIDEVHEVLWSFHHAYAALELEKEDRLMLLVSQFARRVIRVTAQDEYGAFARWVARRPEGFANYLNPYIRFLSQDSDYDEDEDE